MREPSADPNRLVALNDYGPDGLTSQTFAISELACAGRPADPRMLGLQVLTRDYTLAWASGSPEAVAGLYTPSATLADDLAGIQAGSRDQITALAGTTPAEVACPTPNRRAPDLSGPAVFLVASTDFANKDPIRVVTMLVTSDDGQGCPGHIAVRLDLDDHGLVERRPATTGSTPPIGACPTRPPSPRTLTLHGGRRSPSPTPWPRSHQRPDHRRPRRGHVQQHPRP